MTGILAAVVVLAVLSLWLFQRRLIYLPDRSTPTAPAGVEVVTLRTDDEVELTAWWVPGSVTDAAVAVFPGNAGHRAHRLPLAEAIAANGPSVLLVDYRGYGGNPGSPSEDGLVMDARSAGRWLAGRGLARVVYLGESLGSGPATALAAEQPPHALVLRSPFPDLAAVARIHYPFVPASLLLRDRFGVSEWLAAIDAPVTVVAGSADRVIPLRLSEEVARVAGVEPIVVEGADHNDPALGWGRTLIETVLEATR
ncbi:alpha/beta hydrolase [soil metagenome]